MRTTLHVSVTCAEHCRKLCDLHLAATLLTRFLKVTVIAHFFECALAINLLLQPTQRLFDGLAFFQFNLNQNYFTSSLHMPPRPLRGPGLSMGSTRSGRAD